MIDWCFIKVERFQLLVLINVIDHTWRYVLHGWLPHTNILHPMKSALLSADVIFGRLSSVLFDWKSSEASFLGKLERLSNFLRICVCLMVEASKICTRSGRGHTNKPCTTNYVVIHNCLVVYALYFKHFELFVDLLSNVKPVRKHTYNRHEDEKSLVAFLIAAHGT